jgi:hypothetical protein
VQDTALNIDLGQLKGASLCHAQAVTKHQQQKAAVTRCIASSLGGVNEPVNLGRNQMFSFVRHFVKFWPFQTSIKMRVYGFFRNHNYT